MVGSTRLNEHPYDDSEKPRQLWHDDTLHRRSGFRPLDFVGPSSHRWMASIAGQPIVPESPEPFPRFVRRTRLPPSGHQLEGVFAIATRSENEHHLGDENVGGVGSRVKQTWRDSFRIVQRPLLLRS